MTTPKRIRQASAGTASEERVGRLYRVFFFYSVIVLIRPQDMVPGLGLIKPGLLAIVWLVVECIRNAPFDHLREGMAKCAIWFLVSIVVGLPFIVNHHDWIWVVIDVTANTLASILVLPVILNSPRYRLRAFRLIVVSFGIASAWAITHQGHGTGAWLGDENDMAAAAGMGFCFSCSYALFSDSARQKWLGITVLSLCAVAIVVCASRGGYLGFIAGALALTALSGKLVRAAVIGVIVALLAFPLLPKKTIDDFTSIDNKADPTRVERIVTWKIGYKMFLDNPILGVGAANFPWRVGEYETVGPVDPTGLYEDGHYYRSLVGRATHSAYVELFSETGLFGAIPFFLAFYFLMRKAWRVLRLKDRSDKSERMLSYATACGLFSFMVSAVFIAVTYYPEFTLLMGLGLGLRSPATAADQHSAVGLAGPRSTARLKRRAADAK